MRIHHPVWKRGLTFSEYGMPLTYDSRIMDMPLYDLMLEEEGQTVNEERDWVYDYSFNGVCQELRLEELTLDFWGNIDATL